jgi:hypothetical protein
MHSEVRRTTCSCGAPRRDGAPQKYKTVFDNRIQTVYPASIIPYARSVSSQSHVRPITSMHLKPMNIELLAIAKPTATHSRPRRPRRPRRPLRPLSPLAIFSSQSTNSYKPIQANRSRLQANLQTVHKPITSQYKPITSPYKVIQTDTNQSTL